MAPPVAPRGDREPLSLPAGPATVHNTPAVLHCSFVQYGGVHIGVHCSNGRRAGDPVCRSKGVARWCGVVWSVCMWGSALVLAVPPPLPFAMCCGSQAVQQCTQDAGMHGRRSGNRLHCRNLGLVALQL